MTKRKGVREPQPSSGLPATFAEAEREEILTTMRTWPDLMAERLRATGRASSLDDRDAGHRLWQARYEQALAGGDPDEIAVVVALADEGHIAAQWALDAHFVKLVEDVQANLQELPLPIRAYLGREKRGLVPKHPKDRSEVIDHFFRDIAIVLMADAAAAQWALPKLNSSKGRSSAAFYVGGIMGLSEKQVRKIYQNRSRLAYRMASFLVGHNL